LPPSPTTSPSSRGRHRALKTAVDALIALHTDPSQQAAVDALATSVVGVTTAVEAVTVAVTRGAPTGADARAGPSSGRLISK
jgi:hypothetical protein